MEGGVVCGACGEVVEVVCSGEPDGLWLEVCGGEDEAGFMECGECGVAVASVEGAPGPVVCGEGGGEGDFDGGCVFEESVRGYGEVHVVFVAGGDEAVSAFVRRPCGGDVRSCVADGCEEEAQVAFFFFFVSGDEVVCGGADEGEGFSECFPECGEVCCGVGAADFIRSEPCA